MLGNKWLLVLAIPAVPVVLYLIRRIGRLTAAIDRRVGEVRAEEQTSRWDPSRALFDLWEANRPSPPHATARPRKEK
jgi:hypothetical protein